MLRKSMMVLVYDGDLVGWTMGTLVKHLPGKDRWTIFTEQGYSLNRIIIEEYEEMKPNGCGYVIDLEDDEEIIREDSRC